MTTNILKNGVDIDTLFLPLAGTKASNVGIQANGTDITNLFEPIGAGTPIANTSIQANGTDIAQIFRDINEPLTTVTLTNFTASDLVFAGSAVAGFRINTNGTIDKLEGAVYTQLNASTDWIIPNGDASGLYEFMVNGYTGDAWDTSPVANGTWIALGATAKEWKLTVGPGVGSESNSFTLNVRLGAGATLDTCTGAISVERA